MSRPINSLPNLTNAVQESTCVFPEPWRAKSHVRRRGVSAFHTILIVAACIQEFGQDWEAHSNSR